MSVPSNEPASPIEDDQKAIEVIYALLTQHGADLKVLLDGTVVPASDFGEKLAELHTLREQLNERIRILSKQQHIPDYIYQPQLTALNNIYDALTLTAEGADILRSPPRSDKRSAQLKEIPIAKIGRNTQRNNFLIEQYYPLPQPLMPKQISFTDEQRPRNSLESLLRGLFGKRLNRGNILAREPFAKMTGYVSVLLQSDDKIFASTTKPSIGTFLTRKEMEIEARITAHEARVGAIAHHELLLHDVVASGRKIEPKDYAKEREALLKSKHSLEDLLNETQNFCGTLSADLEERLAVINWVYDTLTYPDYHTVLEKYDDPKRSEILQSAFPSEQSERYLSDEQDVKYKRALDKFTELSRQLATRKSYGKQ